MSTHRIESLKRSTNCELRFDDLTRMLYSTDGSIYQIKPLGVAFPKNAEEAAEVIRAAADIGVPVVPRGAGTGLAGGAVGEGLILDMARHTRRIHELHLQARTVRVGAGVVLDQLNAFLRPQGYWFGPDVATSSRATLGGMIANNSSGARSPLYGTTVDHVAALEVVLADGIIATVGNGRDGLADKRAAIDAIIERCKDEIRVRLPEGLHKRWPGYGLDFYLRRRGDLSRIIGGSEGTLAGISSAVLNIVPLPKKRGIGIVFFASVADAMQATVEFRNLNPAAIEHVDRPLFDQTRGQLAFQAARSLMRLDEEPCEAFLIVEFFDDCEDKLAALAKRDVGLRKLICLDPREQELVWALRKSGLTLLTGCKGAAKPTPGLEDVCVRPELLPRYVDGLARIIRNQNLEASYYGHAGAGLLHVRPKLDLHTAEDITRYRAVMQDLSALCREFKGSFAGEHGVGITRTEFMEEQIGPELMQATREIKSLFDPNNLLNPGKVIPNGHYRLDTHLRQGAGHEIRLPFVPVLGYVEKDGSFVGNLEQCNGCGGCRKDAPTMCPTYVATGEEIMSTRGRANTIRAAMEGRLGGSDPLLSEELAAALDNCLSCKACKTECPSNVDLAQLKADLNHARHRKRGLPLLDRMIANADLLGRLNAGPLAPITNAALRLKLTRWVISKTLGFTPERPMPPYARERFDRWFAKRTSTTRATRGRVILFDDTWVRYNEPNIGKAAVRVLESAGFEVVLPTGRKCCGRPAASRGVLDLVRKLGQHNVGHFNGQGGDEPIIFLEPSCYSMFIDDYKNLRIAGAEKVAARCAQFEQFVYELLQREPGAIPFRRGSLKAAIHNHCHTKALTDTSIMPKLVETIPGASGKVLNTGCCGMAGAFGMLKSKYELSKAVAQPLVDQINGLPADTHLIASGTSCRHQITHLTTAEPLHMAELLAMAVE
ncbi:MAG TPA: FAD-linked oxidase C-terminal domain-containing protein [Phycisphaerae bacterium]|nr:FAD-linked oxidase C-terminal domain-containing protein [Phycisphaerae bacterium]